MERQGASEHDPGRERQLRLAAFNHERLSPGLPPDLDPLGHASAPDAGLLADEARFLLEERLAVVARAAEAPEDATGFVAWFEALRDVGPGQGDVLFPWLAESASRDELRWFLRQEVAGEAGFEDLLALTQVKLPERAKLEMARNFWDEMGRGHAGGMHGPMLARLAAELDVVAPSEEIVEESLALGNLMVALATRREYAYHSVGALGVIELTAPGRSSYVNDALVRLGVSPRGRQYFALHATLDKQHSTAWNAEVLTSLVDAQPRVAQAIAEGALLRLTAGARCFARYRAALGVG